VAYAAVVLILSLPLLVMAQWGVGFWEPWETTWAEMAREMAEGGSWLHPTLDGKSVARPLLPLWLTALGFKFGGGAEWAMRLPFGLCATGTGLVLFAWLRKPFGNVRAALAGLAAITSPLLFLSGSTLAGNAVAMFAIALSLWAWGGPGAKPLWRSALFGIALVVGVASYGLWGMVLPLAIVGALGVARNGRPTRTAICVVIAAVALGAVIGWGAWQDWNPRAMQIIQLAVPIVAVGALVGAAWDAVKPPALIIAVLGTAALAGAYVSAGSDAAVAERSIPVVSFLLDNHVVTPGALDAHVSFDFWVRQLGFSTFPWFALLPLGLVWSARPMEELDGTSKDAHTARRALGAWFVLGGILAMFLGSVHEHYLLPMAPAVGAMAILAATDEPFWEHLRGRPMLARMLGFAAVLSLLFMAKDLDRYPAELLGALLTDGKFEAPDSFSLGRPLKVLRYGLMAATAFWFFGGPSVLGRLLPDAGAVLARRVVFGAVLTAGGLTFMALSGLVWVPQLSNHLSTKGLIQSHERFAAEGQPLRTFQVGARNASYYLRDVEKIGTQTAFRDAFLKSDPVFAVIPRDRLSALNYEVRKAKKPRRNLVVLDDRSSRFLLVTNNSIEGQPNLSPVASAILPGRPRPVNTVVVKDEEGARAYTQFGGKLQLIGYETWHEDEVDRFGAPLPGVQDAAKKVQKAGGVPSFKTGEKMVVRYYFKVLKRVTSSQKIFLHVDYPGTRINGDHIPNNGEFPTNHWLPGDYVTDTQWVDVENGSSAGTYTLYMGFFLGSKRMKVTPRAAHDGSDRIKLGTIQVTSF
jgi:4-amino-4-deoxy-L-arabinose transferase-like glycosyltransferase